MTNLGHQGETLVVEFYKKQGYHILHRNLAINYGRQVGEIDIIASKGREIIFIEVKSRSNDRFGGPLVAVDIFKQRKLVRTVKFFMSEHPEYVHWDYRIDVAAVDIDNLLEPVIILPNAIEDTD